MKPPRLLFALASLLTLLACETAAHHPIQEGGEPARDAPWPGNKRCEQTKIKATGKYVNDGNYIDWYPSGKRALVGRYKMGKKDGAWILYDEAGKKLWERWYTDGVQVNRIDMETVPQAVAPPPPPPMELVPEGHSIKETPSTTSPAPAH